MGGILLQRAFAGVQREQVRDLEIQCMLNCRTDHRIVQAYEEEPYVRRYRDLPYDGPAEERDLPQAWILPH